MFHCLADAVLINGSCHIVGCGFYILFGLPHSDSDSCVAEHADIVSSVAEGHRFFQLDAKMPDDFIDAFLFGIAFGCDIRKSRIPAAYFASRAIMMVFCFTVYLFLKEKSKRLHEKLRNS